MKQDIFAQIVFVTTFFLGMTACTPNKMNKVVVDQADSTVEVQRDSAGTTSVRVAARPAPAVPTPMPTTVVDRTPQIESARRELADLQAQLDDIRRRLAEAIVEHDEAVDARAKVVADVKQARHSLTTLNQQIEQLAAAKVALEKELVDLAHHHGKARVKVTENQRVADALTAEIKQLAAEKAAINQELASLTANLDDLRSQIEIQNRELDDLMAQATRPGNCETTPASGSAAAASTIGSPGDEYTVSPVVPIVGGILAIIIAAAIAAIYFFTRKPPVYTFTLLDENSKASHRMQMTPRERVELNGEQPVKKMSAAGSRMPYLTIDRKGRLTLRPMSGFVTKLNDQPVSTTATPVVKPGSVLEIAANGHVNRFVVGPVSAMNQNQKPSMKMPMASVRSA